MKLHFTKEWLKVRIDHDSPCEAGNRIKELHAPDGDTIAIRVKRERIAWGLTQIELAEKSGLSVHRIQQIERGNHSPNWPDARSIAAVLKRRAIWVFRGETVTQ